MKKAEEGPSVTNGIHSWVWKVVLAEVVYSYYNIRTVPGKGNGLEIITV